MVLLKNFNLAIDRLMGALAYSLRLIASDPFY